METKTFEIRDRSTFIPVLATRLEPRCEADRFLFAQAGFGMRPKEQRAYILLSRIDGGGGEGLTDPYGWDSMRTMRIAHIYINDYFDEMCSGSVVDVEFILGETAAAKVSEAGLPV